MSRAPSDRIVSGTSILLHGVGWDLYESLREVPDNWHVRMTYDRGDLEFRRPSHRDKRLAQLIDRLIAAWTEELAIPIGSAGSTTLKREDLQRGCEGDKSYYIENESLMRAHDELDLSVHPPPDFVIEVETTASSLSRLPIHAALGVPEVWRLDGETLRFYELTAEGEYVERDTSSHFPLLKPADLLRFLDHRHTMDETSLAKSFRQWVRESILPRLKDGD